MLKKILSSLTVAIGFTCLSHAQTLYAPGAVGSSTNSHVGIGTNNPQATLDVRGSMFVTGNASIGTTRKTSNPLEVSNAMSFHSGGHKMISFGWAPGNTYQADQSTVSNQVYLAGYPAELRYNPQGSLSFGISSTYNEAGASVYGINSNMLVLNKNGNVGVGVATPTTKLEVSGSIRSVGGSLHATLSNNDLQFNRANNLAYISNVATGGALAFTTSGGSSNTRMFIGGNGNIGIGTTNPGSYKLAVEGKIGAHEIKVTTAGWADFVFKDDYVLRPLDEVEQFIKDKGHLPDVPSEAEVLENGIELGAMDAKLLQKIEELTLYTIEQENRLNQKDQELQELRKEIAEIKALLKQ